MNKFMKAAIQEALIGMNNNHGGPFGAVIVKDDKIIGKGHNKVILNNDPTCHAEIEAIRDACKNIQSYDLFNCDIYVTGEPCPMCLGAIMWSNINKIYYACTIEDNEDIGFRDNVFNEALNISRDKLKDKLFCIDRKEGLKLFKLYKDKLDKEIY